MVEFLFFAGQAYILFGFLVALCRIPRNLKTMRQMARVVKRDLAIDGFGGTPLILFSFVFNLLSWPWILHLRTKMILDEQLEAYTYPNGLVTVRAKTTSTRELK